MIVAFAVLLLVLVAVAGLTTTLLGQAATTHAQVTATDLADQILNEVGEDPLNTLTTEVNKNTPLGTQTVGGETYTMSLYLGWYGTGDAPSLCVTGNPPEVMQATVTVTWGGGGRLAETSVINPPYGAAQSTYGWLSIQIESAADPDDPPSDVTAVTVAVTPQGGSATDYTPDSTGCVYDAVAAGSYTVAVTGPGSPVFVNNNNLTSPPSTAATVTAGQATDVDVQYDEAAQVSFAPASSTPSLATGMPVTVANPGMTAGSQVVIAAGSGGSGPVNLFPFSSGYSVWYGDCTDEQPASPSTVAVTADQSATASITGLQQLTLAVSTTGASVSVSATLADAACTSETYGLTTGTPVSGGVATVEVQIIPETYTLTVKDLSDNSTTSFSVQWQSGSWLDTENQHTYAPTSPIPVSVS